MAVLRHGALGDLPPGEGRRRGLGRRTRSFPVPCTRVGSGEPEPPDRRGSAAVPGSAGGEPRGSRCTLRRPRAGAKPERDRAATTGSGDARPRPSFPLVTGRDRGTGAGDTRCVLVT